MLYTFGNQVVEMIFQVLRFHSFVFFHRNQSEAVAQTFVRICLFGNSARAKLVLNVQRKQHKHRLLFCFQPQPLLLPNFSSSIDSILVQWLSWFSDRGSECCGRCCRHPRSALWWYTGTQRCSEITYCVGANSPTKFEISFLFWR